MTDEEGEGSRRVAISGDTRAGCRPWSVRSFDKGRALVRWYQRHGAGSKGKEDGATAPRYPRKRLRLTRWGMSMRGAGDTVASTDTRLSASSDRQSSMSTSRMPPVFYKTTLIVQKSADPPSSRRSTARQGGLFYYSNGPKICR